jgi:acylphosphatase
MPPAAHVAVELVFTGKNLGPAYLDFVADRARRFSLDGYARSEADDTVRVVLRGPEALVDMLEVACLLGPAECLIASVEARSAPDTSIPAGFALPARFVAPILLGPDRNPRPADSGGDGPEGLTRHWAR